MRRIIHPSITASTSSQRANRRRVAQCAACYPCPGNRGREQSWKAKDSRETPAATTAHEDERADGRTDGHAWYENPVHIANTRNTHTHDSAYQQAHKDLRQHRATRFPVSITTVVLGRHGSPWQQQQQQRSRSQPTTRPTNQAHATPLARTHPKALKHRLSLNGVLGDTGAGRFCGWGVVDRASCRHSVTHTTLSRTDPAFRGGTTTDNDRPPTTLQPAEFNQELLCGIAS
jgi:hypothetical protein